LTPTHGAAVSLHDALPICAGTPGDGGASGKKPSLPGVDLSFFFPAPLGEDSDGVYGIPSLALCPSEMEGGRDDEAGISADSSGRSGEDTSELQSRFDLVCR